jgi:hypothetical protein
MAVLREVKVEKETWVTAAAASRASEAWVAVEV